MCAESVWEWVKASFFWDSFNIPYFFMVRNPQVNDCCHREGQEEGRMKEIIMKDRMILYYTFFMFIWMKLSADNETHMRNRLEMYILLEMKTWFVSLLIQSKFVEMAFYQRSGWRRGRRRVLINKHRILGLEVEEPNNCWQVILCII